MYAFDDGDHGASEVHDHDIDVDEDIMQHRQARADFVRCGVLLYYF
jgi:hypothetical protein